MSGNRTSRPFVDFDELDDAVARCTLPVRRGRVTAVRELSLEATLPGARSGMRVDVERSDGSTLPAVVAIVEGERVGLIPLDVTTAVGAGDKVAIREREETLPCGDGLLGRVINPFGRPLDSGPALEDVAAWPLTRPAPRPLERLPVDTQLDTGIRAVDGCLAVGLGQRLGLFAGPGLGKTTLLGALARRASVDVSVICLVGERGREVRDLLDRVIGRDHLERSVVVLAPADSPPLVRVRALEAATAVAEYFRAQGGDVLLLVDSLTRVVRARRDVGLALGEAPSRAGFPSSAFATLPTLLERAGRDDKGSITAVYAVLTEGRDDDPVAEEARSLLDGHIALSERLARAGWWPAIDLNRSVSRVMDGVVPAGQLEDARTLCRWLGAHHEHRDLIAMGAYRTGTTPDADMALDRMPQIRSFLQQNTNDPSDIATTRGQLAALVAPPR